MGTWSITPNTGLASIDNTGKLTYQEHTEDRVYTISYSDDTCGTITKETTIKKCEGPEPPSTSKLKVYFLNDSHRTIEIISIKIVIPSVGTYTVTPDESGMAATIAQCDCDDLYTTFTVTPALPENPEMPHTVRVTAIEIGTESTFSAIVNGFEEGNPPTLKLKYGNNGCLPCPS